MQVSVFVCLTLVGLLLAEGTSSGNCVSVSYPKQRGQKPREIRGFQPEYISTAIGFGKREVARQNKHERTKLPSSVQSFIITLLLHEMSKDPELMDQMRRILEGVRNEETERAEERLSRLLQTAAYQPLEQRNHKKTSQQQFQDTSNWQLRERNSHEHRASLISAAQNPDAGDQEVADAEETEEYPGELATSALFKSEQISYF